MSFTQNLFGDLAVETDNETFDAIIERGNVRIERIVSHGHASPDGYWYDQPAHEWVVVLRGKARLRIEGRDAVIELGPGDHIELPARCRHRVEWTTRDEPTIWLAVHYEDPKP